MFSNTVKIISNGSSTPTVSQASLIDVTSGKSTRRVILDASTVLDVKLANATTSENAPSGSTRYNVRVDVRKTVTNDDGTSRVMTTSAYIVLVIPKAAADFTDANRALDTLFGFLAVGDGDLGSHLVDYTQNFHIPARSITTAGNPLNRILAGEL